MKKFTKMFALLGVAGAVAFGCASCTSGVSQKYADQINEEAKDDDGKYVTYDEAKKKLGKNCTDITVALGSSRNGILIAVDGCSSKEDIQKKLDEGKEVKGIVITVLNNNCTAAVYRTITASDVK